MTHEELLAKIKPALHRPEFCNNCACGVKHEEMYDLKLHIEEANNKYILALRAVVKLCKPTKSDEVYDSTWKEVIIQTIEKELV